MSNAPPLSMLENLAIVVDDPVADGARSDAGTIAADISIGADRPSSIGHNESANQQFH